jgi:hypothetical protein
MGILQCSGSKGRSAACLINSAKLSTDASRTQDFCDGRIGVHGVSYMGMTCWAVAGSGDPAVPRTVRSPTVVSRRLPAEKLFMRTTR